MILLAPAQVEVMDGEVARLMTSQPDQAAEIFAAGALLALSWLKHGGMSPAEYLSHLYTYPRHLH